LKFSPAHSYRRGVAIIPLHLSTRRGTASASIATRLGQLAPVPPHFWTTVAKMLHTQGRPNAFHKLWNYR
jgi:hypothetical protein